MLRSLKGGRIPLLISDAKYTTCLLVNYNKILLTYNGIGRAKYDPGAKSGLLPIYFYYLSLRIIVCKLKERMIILPFIPLHSPLVKAF